MSFRKLQIFSSCQIANTGREQSTESTLSHWPVKIRLVPPHAPFLQGGADLLITADCVPLATSAHHSLYLPGKVDFHGCPKFEETEEYVQKKVN